MKSLIKRMRVAPKILILVFDVLTRLLAWTQRLDTIDASGYAADPDPTGPAIFVIWHNRFLLISPILPKRIRKRLHFLASRSRDGNYIAAYMIRVGMQPIRGSSSRGGARALGEMKKVLDAGGFVALTPDGPRGPRYQVQDGVVWLASQTGAPVYPASFNSRSHWEARSWDRTQIAKPFSRGELRVGPAIRIAADLDADGFEAARQEIRDGLLAVTRFDHPAPEDTDSSDTDTETTTTDGEGAKT